MTYIAIPFYCIIVNGVDFIGFIDFIILSRTFYKPLENVEVPDN